MVQYPKSSSSLALLMVIGALALCQAQVRPPAQHLTCGSSFSSRIVNGAWIPYYLDLQRSTSSSGNWAVRLSTCRTQFDSSLCVGTEWVDDAHSTGLGYFPRCGNSATPYLENFVISLPPGRNIIQTGAYSQSGSGTVVLDVSCEPTNAPAEVLENHERCTGSRSYITQSPTPPPSTGTPTGSPTFTFSPTSSPVPCPDGFGGPQCQFSDEVTCNGAGEVDFHGGCSCDLGAVGDFCYTSENRCNGVGNPSSDGSCSCNTGHAGATCQFSDEIQCNDWGTVLDDGTCNCLPINDGGLFTGTSCSDHICGSNLTCYKEVSSVGLDGPSGWRQDVGDYPKEHEPTVECIPGTNDGFHVSVRVRGTDGILSDTTDSSSDSSSLLPTPDLETCASETETCYTCEGTVFYVYDDNSGQFAIAPDNYEGVIDCFSFVFGLDVTPSNGRCVCVEPLDSGPPPFSDDTDKLKEIWLTDETGSILCHQSYSGDELAHSMHCDVARYLVNGNLISYAFFSKSGLFNSVMVDAVVQSYVAGKKEECYPSGNGGSSWRQFYATLPQKLESISSGNCDIFVPAHNGPTPETNIVVLIESLPGLTAFSFRQLSKGIGDMASHYFSLGCTYDGTSSIFGSCNLFDTIDLAIAFVEGCDGAMDLETKSGLRTVYHQTLPGLLDCIAVDGDCQNATLAFQTAMTSHGVPSVQSYYWAGRVIAIVLSYLPDIAAQISETMVENVPYLSINGDSATCSVLGPDGSLQNLRLQSPPIDYVEIIWVEDIRGTVVHFVNISNSTGAPSTQFSLPSDVTGLIPYQYSPIVGLWQGVNPLDKHSEALSRFTVGLVSSTGQPVPNGRYICGGIPRQYEPVLQISVDGRPNILIRGPSGSLRQLLDPIPRIIRVWITNEHGHIVCDARSLSALAIDCVIHRYVNVQVFVHYESFGLWSGPKYNVQQELATGTYERRVAYSQGYQEVYHHLMNQYSEYRGGNCVLQVFDPVLGSQTLLSVIDHWMNQHNYAWTANGGCVCGGNFNHAQIGRGMAEMVLYARSCDCYYRQLSVSTAVRLCMTFVTTFGIDTPQLAIFRTAFVASLPTALDCDLDDQDCIENAYPLYINSIPTQYRDVMHSYFIVCIRILRYFGQIVDDFGPTSSYHQAIGSFGSKLAYYQTGFCDAVVIDAVLGRQNIMFVVRHWLEEHNRLYTSVGNCLCGGDITDVQIGTGISHLVRYIHSSSLPMSYTSLSLENIVEICIQFFFGATHSLNYDQRHDYADMIIRLRYAFNTSVQSVLLCDVNDLECIDSAKSTYTRTLGHVVDWADRAHAYFSICWNIIFHLEEIMADATSYLTMFHPYQRIAGDQVSSRVFILGEDGSKTQILQQSPNHSIEAIWIKDQSGKTVHYEHVLEGSVAETTFAIEAAEGKFPTSLIPYQYSNIHGLWRGLDVFSLQYILQENVAKLVDTTGVKQFNGMYGPGCNPEMWEPSVKIDIDYSVNVQILGQGGDSEIMPVQTADTYVTHLWLVNEHGEELCKSEFDAPKDESSPWMSDCVLPTSSINVKCYVRVSGKGLYGGKELDVQAEIKAQTIKMRTAAFGNGNASYRAVNLNNLRMWDPYTFYDGTTKTGWCVILGPQGSFANLASSEDIEAIWFEDQHGDVVLYVDQNSNTSLRNVSIDLSAVASPISKLFAFAYVNGRLHRSENPLGFQFKYQEGVLNGDMPSPSSRYEIDTMPKENDPALQLTSSGEAKVTIRGADGSKTAEPALKESISNIWITDENNAVICEKAFSFSSDDCQYKLESGECYEEPKELECTLPDDVSNVKAHQYSTTHGLYSGPEMNVANEKSAAAYDEMTSKDGTGGAKYTEANPLLAQENDPYATFLSKEEEKGWCAVLGPFGSTEKLADDIAAIWIKDQHDTVVYYNDSTSVKTEPNVTFDFTSKQPRVTEAIPYAYSTKSGLRKGLDGKAEPSPSYFAGNSAGDSESDDDGFPWWIIIVIVAAVLVVGAAVALLANSSGGAAAKPDDEAFETPVAAVSNPMYEGGDDVMESDPTYEDIEPEVVDKDGGYLDVAAAGKDIDNDEEEVTGFD